VSGVVRWQEGSPAANFTVSAVDIGSGARRPAGATRSGPDGQFTLELLEGRTYTFATPHFGPRDQVQLVVTPFLVHEAMPPVRVVIPRDPRAPSH
jgi:hypothetical protein